MSTTWSKLGFLLASMSAAATSMLTVNSVRLGSKPSLTPQMQFLVRLSQANSTASCGFCVALTMIGTTLSFSR